ncbi:MAG: hypothetical protein K6F69_00275, partial [Treponema sp.]|nr:hypothetical protein [Treponema sp.]
SLDSTAIYSDFSYSLNKNTHKKNIYSTITIKNNKLLFNSLSFSYKTSFYKYIMEENKSKDSCISSNLTFLHGKNISLKGTISLKVVF